jgi:hypothetical protein
MYSLNCDYYEREFETINELVDDVISSEIMRLPAMARAQASRQSI